MSSNIHIPTVSVGVPVYNGDNFLAGALESLLAQTHTDIEIIISDNASTDGTEEICNHFTAQDDRIQYHRSPVNKGAAWNFNNTFKLARGKYFKWAAHDDIHYPDFIKKCVELLDSSPDVVLAFTRTTFIDDSNHEYMEYPYPVDISNMARRERFFHFVDAMHIVHEIFGLIRADELRKTPLIGGYWGADIILLGKLAMAGKIVQIPEVLFQHREHDKRSIHNHPGADNFTQWFDSSKKGTFIFPLSKRLWENTKTVITYPMGLEEKLGCMIDLLRHLSWRKRSFLNEYLHPKK